MTETQQRFLKAIADRVAAGRVAEVRLFPTVRSGQTESGVAIVAVEGLAGSPADVMGSPDPGEADPVAGVQGDRPDNGVPAASSATGSAPDAGPEPVARLSILTAHFRHTVKGPDRGKWEFQVVHDADAPLETVESVVRGVARRVGEEGEPDLIPGDSFALSISQPWWTAQAGDAAS